MMESRVDSRGGLSGALTIALITGMLGSCDGPVEDVASVALDVDGVMVDTIEPLVVHAETISIEGSPQQIVVVEFRAPMGFPIGFETAVPTDMVVEYLSSGKGDEVRFEAAFEGTRHPGVSLTFTALPEGTDSTEARERVAEVAAQIGAAPEATNPGDWVVERYGPAEGSAGFLALGTVGSSWYYFLARYPPEYSDGMGPRVDLILRRWIWVGTGTPLMPG